MQLYLLLIPIFIVVFALEMRADFTENLVLKKKVKPFLMPLLIVYYLLAAININFLIVFGLFFGFLGDVFLLDKKRFFLLGLASFLLGHIMYIIAFIRSITIIQGISIITYIFIVILVIGGALIFRYLSDGLGKKKIPTLVYLITIITMSITSLLRINSVPIEPYLLVVFGSLFFVVSDSLLSINYFKKPIKKAGIYIMSTYCIAQILIMIGFL